MKLVSREAGFSEHESNFENQLFQNLIFEIKFLHWEPREIMLLFSCLFQSKRLAMRIFKNLSTNDRDCNEHNGRSFYLSAFGVKFKWGSSVTSFWRVWKFVDILISCWLIHYEYAKNCTTVLTWKNKILTLFILYPNLYTKV